MSNLMNNPSSAIDRAAQSADKAITSTQTAANQAIDGMANTAHKLQDDAVHLTQRSVDAVRQGSQHLRESALHAKDSTLGYIKDEPVKSMLIAAATGAALMALLGLMSRSRSHH
ncbi:MAG: hypothetical protein Q8R98_09840 [Rubrivivax sp.]|nr:hypothetical protein [Rubrivivax sp.]MDP3222081.1 hypothetical protein [Rubrivivax sp.]MDP3612142.1 hypothetical protein [Rubrivivax sp.]